MSSTSTIATALVLALCSALTPATAMQSAAAPDRANADLLLAQEASPPPAEPDAPGAPGVRRHHGPPPEAFAACEGKSSGAPCSFTDRRSQAHSGSCFAPPPPPDSDGKPGATPRLFCRPAHRGGETAPAH